MERWMEGESIRALEFMPANWRKVQSSQPTTPTPHPSSLRPLLSHSHGDGKQFHVAAAPRSTAQLWPHKKKNTILLVSLHPDNCVFKKALWRYRSVWYRVFCSASPVTGRGRPPRRTCRTWRATEQRRPKNDEQWASQGKDTQINQVKENRLGRCTIWPQGT